MMICTSKRKTIVKEPSDSFTRVAKRTLNILMLINKQSNLDNFDEVLDNMKNDHNDQLNLKKRIESLRIELKEKQKSLSISEFNKK
ncbi:hypothetical protein C1645_815920 [Glomus cerebriforme]|uniref:Uncharacterized protein n=1 Tax=Glomus cerebriforme TaxID=658196 RepID=A0A397TD35_9GLOM|nr:hypothetical protein C1645_815920 [Glomus cerebriforme]